MQVGIAKGLALDPPGTMSRMLNSSALCGPWRR
jgi:hypothetical protein